MNTTFAASGSNQVADSVVAPNVWLCVSPGQSASPFLPVGMFDVTWEGVLSADRRGNYWFRAELNGAITLELNGVTILNAQTNGAVETPKPILLNKGTNTIVARFKSFAEGEVFLRLLWKPKDSFFQPIPSDALTHREGQADAGQFANLHLGRELFLNHRCAKCHMVASSAAAVPELSQDAPAFEGIGSRLNSSWVARWVQNPRAARATATMPQILRGPQAQQESEAIAAFLATFKSPIDPASSPAMTPDQINAGQKLFDSLHCAACHQAPNSAGNEPTRISLKQVQQKFAPGALATFLQKPEAHYAWTRMPNFKLSAAESGQLSAYLISVADKPFEKITVADAEVERGKILVQTSGCLNCHTLKLDNRSKTSPLANLTADKWNKGCLTTSPDGAGKAPTFDFTADQRSALQGFATTDRGSLMRHVPWEFAERQTRALNCRECHGKFEGFPAFDILGGKLKPEWMGAFIAGTVAYKPRPWLEARMPSFTQRAELLAQGLAMQHGFPPQTPSEPSVDGDAAKAGATLISAMPGQGFSCVSCHAVGEASASLTFESPGLNFVHSGERLQNFYFQHWVRNPQLIDPATKMPVYFDGESKSPIASVLDGDSARQIDAIWQYFRLGDRMPPPPKP